MSLSEEELRFRAAIPKSLEAVRAFDRFMRARGYETEMRCDTEVPIVNGERGPYFDGEDLIARKGGEDWVYFEIKGRTLRFTGRADFPFQTIIVDRIKKVDARPSVKWYVSLSRDLSAAAAIDVATKPSWIRRTVFDHSKGYDAANYECPVELVRFFRIRS